MKRIALLGLAVFAMLGLLSPRAVQADGDPTTVSENAGLVSAILNPILALLPTPEGWEQRRVCVGNVDLDKAWCIYIAWPY